MSCTRLSFSLALLFLVLLPPASAAQTAGEKAEGPPPGNMQIVPGYQHRRLQGIDTSVGEILKGDRVVIRYDIGRLAGLHVTPEDKARCKHYEEKRISGQTARYCFRDHELTATFVQTSANFYATPADDAELNDVLIMLDSYRPYRVIPKEPKP
ncbi:MAG TPA: hypothetical protein VEW48_13105 [Thermoanaerobaculia bacterium]|nr:hypothetical protein [Thermoanaerobaculia bacterium]